MNSSTKNPAAALLRIFLLALVLSAGGVTAKADYSSAVLSDGPFAYFRLNETYSTVPDLATNFGTIGVNGNGLYIGSVTQTTGGALTGSADKATGFDGSGAHVEVPFSASLSLNAPFTVEAWVNPSVSPPPAGQSSLAAVLSCAHIATDPNRSGWLLYQAADGWNLRLYNGAGSGTGVNITGGPTPVAGTWYHVAAVYDGTTAYVYVNGVQAASSPVTGFAANTDAAFTIGTRSDGAFGYSGKVDEAVLYTNALSTSQILAHYQNGTNPSPSTPYSQLVLNINPICYYRLNEQAPVNPTALNAGTFGPSANGSYFYPATPVAGPQAPAYPALEASNTGVGLDGTNAFVRFPQSGNFTNTALASVTEASFVCWVKRNGPQAEYKGLVAMRPLSSGLYLNTDDTLNYSWNDAGNTYGFNSALIPPDGEWTLAAVVVQPSQAIFYMGSISGGFVSTINTVSHSPADFTSGPFAIGRDINVGGTGRFFKGTIDEAAVFNKGLPEARIRTYFLTAIADPNPPVLASDPPTVTPSGTIYSGTTFSLSVDAYGSSPLFLWRKDGAVLPGATSTTYTKANASLGDSGNYDVVITNAYGSVTSSVVTISINPAVPPTISQQPVSRSVYNGGAGSFSVAATGTTPFSYQWKHSGTNLPGATGSSLSVSAIDATKTGGYSVTVTNVAGNTDSATATLTIRTPLAGTYESALVGLGPLAYWRLDETSGPTAFDLAGGHDGTYSLNVAHVAGALNGDADGAANFNGSDAFVGTGEGLLNGLTRFSMAGWVRRGGAQATRTGLFGQNDNVEFGFIDNATIEIWDNVVASAVDTPNPLAEGVWGFIVVTSDGTNRTIYVNGRAIANGAARTGPGTNSFPFNIGGGGIFDVVSVKGNWFLGDIDDVALFSQALTADQVNTLYLVGAYGTNSAPVFVQEPVSQTNVVGGTARIDVIAGGSVPLNYQWKKNGSPISGATSATLTLPNVYFTDAGNYSVQVGNGIGTTNSASAVLTVMPAPTFANQTNGLVLHLNFDVDYKDSSGRANDATPVNAPALVPGKLGRGVRVNTDSGSSTFNYVEVLDINVPAAYPDLQFGASDSFSVAYWAKYTGLPQDLPIIGNAPGSTYQPGWVFSDDTGKVEWTITSVAPDTGQVIADPVPASPTVNNGAWHHVLVAFNRATSRADTYVDGVSVDSRSITGIGNLDTLNGVILGQDPSGAYGVTGTYDLDDVGIWRRALTGYDALAVYNAAQNSNESFDVYGPVKVYVRQVGSNIDVSWQSGTLQSSTNVLGPYAPVPGAIAPFYRTTATGPGMYFRVRQ